MFVIIGSTDYRTQRSLLRRVRSTDACEIRSRVVHNKPIDRILQRLRPILNLYVIAVRVRVRVRVCVCVVSILERNKQTCYEERRRFVYGK